MTDEWNKLKYVSPIWASIWFLKILKGDEKAEICEKHVGPVSVKLCNKGKINFAQMGKLS